MIGFYTQSMAEVDFSSFPEAIQKKLPKHPVPAVRIGRLAVDGEGPRALEDGSLSPFTNTILTTRVDKILN